ncbi:deoxyribose-phosphate aldolase [Flagellimonas olearia]|uniref:Deoxyribose-phosphate aldolase n=1 Tax=Flagellimonas olearia TaxID=552546 RepID=A0A444VH41_9FLAO|nr:deoxyribose-phosphate aldolase [Allomuricauda olearia]RYC50074.1 deoxyribose-phosphate aldolase [Allomuricauda olearia]
MHLPDFIDHTHLKPTATLSEIQHLCEEAKRFGFHAVCVNGSHVSLASEELKNTKVKIAAVVGFPLGAMSTEAKIFEAKDCVKNGADEIDMVINIGWLKSNEDDRVRNEIISIKQGIGDKILKVILETCYLTTSEKEKACILAVEAGADFVKTSTGFGSGGATFEDVTLMKRMVGDKVKIKASGGIKDKETALKYIALGVSRIGTSSGPALLN